MEGQNDDQEYQASRLRYGIGELCNEEEEEDEEEDFTNQFEGIPRAHQILRLVESGFSPTNDSVLSRYQHDLRDEVVPFRSLPLPRADPHLFLSRRIL
jgi:hypothetical protein